MRSAEQQSLQSSSRLRNLPGYGRGRIASFPAGTARLGSNENSIPPSEQTVEQASNALTELNRYPDLRGESLSAALAELHGLRIENVAVSAGSVVMLDLLVRAYCDAGDDVLTAWPSYEAYPIIAGGQGCSLTKIPLTQEQGVDLDAIVASISDRTRIVLICNPNNPTGTAVSLQEIDRILNEIPKDRLVILDEAYAEYNPSRLSDISNALAEHSNLAVLRTFSKAYGLAGMRIGYCLASSDIIDAVQALQPPFPLPTPALTAAISAVGEQQSLAEHIASNEVERRRLTDELRAIGLSVADSYANFVFLPLGEESQAFSNALSQDGIVTRCFPGDGVRITIATSEDSMRVIEAAGRWFNSK